MSELYSIVIVDDEKWALIYLNSLFNSPDNGFEVVSTCRCPQEAIKIIEKEKPDVLITDIRMPEINGIELIEHVRSMDIPCEIVIISGFAEFEYAKEAVRLGAFEYILKPISTESAKNLLTRLRKKLDSKIPLPIDILEDGDSDHAFADLLSYVRQNYSKRLYLKDLAHQFSLAPNYCCNLFIKVKGITFSQYVTQLRMEKAALLLAGNDYTINKVAQLVGFDDYSYFNRVFKRIFSCTPSEYRKQFIT